MNITKPIIRKIKDNETALAEFEKEIKTNEAEDTKDIIMNFPTVYIHNWPETNKYDVYVGESNNIFARTRQHYQSRIKHETWQYRMMKTDASLYIIGHEHFNKSLTLDVENRLMHYLMSVDKVHQVHNGRGNPQKHYYPSAEFEEIFRKIWTELHESDEELFPDENIVKDSAIYKASPLHKLTDEQENAKIQILECIDLARQKHEKQIIFIDGEAGTGKTVLNSNIFYELYCQEEEKDNAEFKCCMVVNHDEQVKVYSDIAKKLGITEKYGEVVSKASTFLNRHKDLDSVDVVFIDEAHLLFTQGNQGYSGKNQLDDIIKRAKVVVIVFDENQILRMDQYWEKQMIDRYRNKAIEQQNYITLTKQLRMQADNETLAWIDAFTKKQIINKIPHHDYEIKIFDSPEALLALVTLFSRLRSFAGEEKQPFFDRGYFTQIFAIAVPSILQQSVLSVGNLFVQDIVNRYGSAVVAGYSGAIKLNTFAINIFMTLGSCLSSYTAQNIGAGKAERIPLGFRTGLKLSAVAAVPFVVLYVGFSRQMMGLFLNAKSGAAITAGMDFLRIVAPWYLMIVVKLMTDGIIRGAGAMTYFVAATVPDLIIRILFAMMFSKNFGSTGIWMAWPFGWIAATVLTLIFYRKVRRQSGDLA